MGGVANRIHHLASNIRKEENNTVADALSCVATKLNAEAVKFILDGVTIGTAGRANAHDPMVAEADERMHQQVEEIAVQGCATHICVNLHVMDWVAVQQEDPIPKCVREWISSHRMQDLKHLLGDHAMMEERMAILRERRKFTLSQGALYYCHTPARELEEALQFIVPMAHRVVAMNGCHRDMGHHCPCCKTSFGGLTWQCGGRRQSVAVKGVFNRRAPK